MCETIIELATVFSHHKTPQNTAWSPMSHKPKNTARGRAPRYLCLYLSVLIKIHIHNRLHVNQAVPRGFALASFFAFCSDLAFFFFSFTFSSFFLFRFSTSSSVFCTGLKKPSNRACCAVLRFLLRRAAALRTRSSLNPFSVTRKVTKPSTSGASHLKSQSGWSGGRTSGLKKSSRASL